MSFWYANHTVRWQGYAPSKMAVRVLVGEEGDLMNVLLEDFTTLFTEPCGLPLAHRCDHRIHLEAGTGAVVVQPYRYP